MEEQQQARECVDWVEVMSRTAVLLAGRVFSEITMVVSGDVGWAQAGLAVVAMCALCGEPDSAQCVTALRARPVGPSVKSRELYSI